MPKPFTNQLNIPSFDMPGFDPSSHTLIPKEVVPYPEHPQERTAAYEEMKLASDNANRTTARLLQLKQDLVAMKTRLWVPLTGGGERILRGIFPGLETPEELEKEIALVEEEDLRLSKLVGRANWKLWQLTYLEESIKSGLVKTVEDMYFSYSEEGEALPYHPTPDEEEWATALFGRVKEAGETQKALALEATDAMVHEARPGLVGIDDLTVAEILNAYTSHPEVVIPDDLSLLGAEGLREIFANYGMDEEIEKYELGLMERSLAASASWFDMQSNYNAWIAGKESPEPVRLNIMQKLKVAFTQPALALVEVSQPYFSYWSRPMAYIGASMLGEMQSLPSALTFSGTGTNEWSASLDTLRREQESQGMSTWKSMGVAYDDWEQNEWLKLAIEIGSDPLTYFGFGIATKITKPLGWLGRDIAAAEKAFMNFADIPFVAGRKVWSGIGQTTHQMSNRIVGDAIRTMLDAVPRFTQTFDLARLTATNIRETARAAFKVFLKDPQMAEHTYLHRFGASIYQAVHKFTSRAEVETLLTQLGVTVDYSAREMESLIVNMTDNVNTVVEGVTSKLVTPDDAVIPLMDVLNVVDTPMHRQVAKHFLEGIVEKEAILVETMFSGDSARTVANRFLKNLQDNFLTNQSSKVALHRSKYGMMAAMQTSADMAIKTIWRDFLEKRIVLPVARQMLLTANYGNFNMFESVMRSALSGYGLWGKAAAGRDIIEIASMGNMGLYNTPVEFGQQTLQQLAARGELYLEAVGPGVLPLFTTAKIPDWVPLVGSKVMSIPQKVGTKRIPFFGGRQLSLYDWNQFFNRLGMQHRAYIWTKMQRNHMFKMYPKQMADITKAIGSINPKLYNTIRAKDLETIQRGLEMHGMIGPQSLDEFIPIREVLIQNRFYNDVGDLAGRMRSIDADLGDFLVEQTTSGRITHLNIDEYVGDIKQTYFNNHVLKLQQDKAVMMNATRQITEMTGEVTEQELLHMINNVNDLFQTILPRSTTEHYAAVTIRGHKIISAAKVEKLHKGAHTEMMGYLNESVQQATAMRNALSSKLNAVANKKDIPQLQALMDTWTTRAEKLVVVRNQVNDVIERYVQMTPSKQRTIQGWRQVHADADAMWRQYWLHEADILAQGSAAMRELYKMPLAAPPVVGNKLLIRDVAHIFGGTSDALRDNLVFAETRTMMGKQHFQATVYGQATDVSKAAGKGGADEIGFSWDAIGEVYDDILRGIGIDPTTASQFAPAMGELDIFAASWKKAYYSKNISPDDYTRLHQHVHDVKDRLSKLDMFRHEVDVTPEAFTTKLVKNKRPYQLNRKEFKRDFNKQMKAVNEQASGDAHFSNVGDTEIIVTTETEFKQLPRTTMTTDKHTFWSADKKYMGELHLEIFPDSVEVAWLGLESGARVSTIRQALKMIYEASEGGTKTIVADVNQLSGRLVQNLERRGIVKLAPFEGTEVMHEKGLLPRLMGDVEITINKVPSAEQLVKKVSKTEVATFDPSMEMTSFELAGTGTESTYWQGAFKKNTSPEAMRLKELMEVNPNITDPDELFELWRTKAIGEGLLPKSGRVQKEIMYQPPTQKETRFEATPDWWAKRDKSAEQAAKEYYLTFTDYTNQNMMDAFMKSIYPFWIYESRRWPYVMRTGMRTPGTIASLGKYMDYTEGGYVNIPGLPIDMNFLRGTVWMGGFRRLYVRDYPEYYDAPVFKDFASVVDAYSRMGFYPNILISGAVSLFGAKEGKPQVYEILPPAFSTLFNFHQAINPDGAIQKQLREVVFSDRFRNYMLRQALTEMGFDGDVIMTKKEENDPLSEEEENAISTAMRTVALWSVPSIQAGLFRFRPEDRDLAYQMVLESREAMTGVPIDMQKRETRFVDITGNRMSDRFPLTPWQQRLMNEADLVERWNKNFIAPLLPSEQGNEESTVLLFWNEIEQVCEQARETGFPDFMGDFDVPLSETWLEQELLGGRMSPKTYDHWMTELSKELASKITGIANESKWSGVPLTLEERRERYIKHGEPVPIWSPARELKWMYREISPKMVFDPEIDGWVMDYESYYAQVDIIMNAMTDAQQAEFLADLHYEWTETKLLRWKISRDFLRPYYNSRYAVMERYTPEEQNLIKEYLTTADSGRREEIKGTMSSDGEHLLISLYTTELGHMHQNLRQLDPEMDAWLRVWGIVDTSRTSQAERMYYEFMDTYFGGSGRHTPVGT